MFEIYIGYCIRKPVLSIAVFITLLPLILLIARKAYKDQSFKLLFFYLIFKLIIDLIMFHSASVQKNNVLFYNLSIPVFYALLSGMFYFKLSSKRVKSWLIISMIGFTLFTIWDVFNSNPNMSDLHNHRAVLFSKTIEGFLIITVILLYFYEIIRSLQIPNLLTFPFFWICSGLLLYYSSVIFIAPVLHYTATWNNLVNFDMIRIIPVIFEILCSIFFSIGIYYFSTNTHAKQ